VLIVPPDELDVLDRSVSRRSRHDRPDRAEIGGREIGISLL